jgi:ATP-dependent RNA helicase DDX5/DBP2
MSWGYGAYQALPSGAPSSVIVPGAYVNGPSTTSAPLTLRAACEAAGRGSGSGHCVDDSEILVHGPDERPIPPVKVNTFEEVREFPQQILAEFRKAGFPGPSQIQAYTWPLALQGKDVIGIAATGSGKTLAFLLPAFCEMLRSSHNAERMGPGLLVMSPTRELAQQTEQEAERFGRSIGFRVVAMYGGAQKHDQISKYRNGVHTIVACPGRLNDFLEGGQVRLDAVSKLVLDEADRMLDMGFEPQIRKILARIPKKRQTLFFTATWPKEVRKLANEILYYPYKVMIGHRDELKGNQDIIQQVRMIESYEKDKAIVEVLKEAGLMDRNAVGKALVFASTKRMCEQLSNNLWKAGVSCSSIHGDKDQRQRDEALNGLKSGKLKVLVATDVAARGLDIKGVGLVVNYDAANNTEDYVHRIGRTGRAGCKGFAVTFLSRQDAAKSRGIMEVMQRTNQTIPRELEALAKNGGYEKRDRWGGGGGGSSWKSSSSYGDSGGSWGGSSWSSGGGGGGRWGSSGGYSSVNSTPLGGRGRSRSPRR